MKFLFILMLLATSTNQLIGQVSFSASTNKSVYNQNDTILVTITLRNLGDAAYTVWFCSSCESDFRIDSLDWRSQPYLGHLLGCLESWTPLTIPAHDSVLEILGGWWFSFTGASVGTGQHAVIPLLNLCNPPGYDLDTIWIVVTPFHFPVEYNISGWNLVSVPTIDTNMNANILFPNKISSVFKYDNGYSTIDSLTNGQGYWIRTASAEEDDFLGQPINSDTIQLVTGWNLIGTICYPVNVDSIEEQPAGIISSNFFGYNRAYLIVDTLQPGQGYWVKANQAGSLIVKKSGLGASATYRNIPRNVSASEIPPAPDQTTGVKGINFPREFALSENYPNPFNPTTIIHYDLPIAVHVRLTISDVLGREVTTLVNELQQPGSKSVEFNSTALPSGVYFYRIVAGDFVQTKKMVLMK